jgi:hypothetical protein
MSSSSEAIEKLTNAQKQQRVAHAAGALATQVFIQYAETTLRQSEEDQHLRDAYNLVRSRRIPVPSEFRRMLSGIVGGCELAFRSSICTDESVTKHSGILVEAASCAVVEKSEPASTEDADYMDFFEEILKSVDMSPSMPANGYGRRCNVEKEAEDLYASFETMYRVHSALVSVVLKQHSLERTESRPAVANVNDTLVRIREMLTPESEQLNKQTRQKVLSQMMVNQHRFESIKHDLDALKRKVAQHVQERVARGRSLLSTDTLDADCLMKVLEFVDYRSASACLSTCRFMRDEQEIRKLMPHLSFRNIPGIFPHKVAPGIDGGNCNYIAKKALTHVYVDLAITGMRRNDAESVRLQTTREHTPRDTSVYRSRAELQDIAEEDKRMAARKAPEETVDESRFRRRLCHESFFSTPIECSFSLVCAITHEEIPGSRGASPLTLPKWMRKRTAPNRTYTSSDNVPYPAHAAFNIEELSNDYTDRKFKIKVVGKARTLPNERKDSDSVYTQTLTAYSEAFEIVSNKAVSLNVRKRADESKQRASKKQAKAPTA